MHNVKLDEAQTRLSDLINAAVQGETVLITNDNQQVVRLVPISEPRRRQFGSAKGLISITDDFDDPLPEFDEYK